MSKTLIVSNGEIKTLTQSGASDALLTQWNQIATEMLCDMLGVSDLAVHSVLDERVAPKSPEFLALSDFPVDVSEDITLKNIYDFLAVSDGPDSYYLDPNTTRHLRAKDSSGNAYYFPKYEVLASYTAGYTVIDTLRFVGNASDGNTLTVVTEGVEKVWTFKSSVSDETIEILIGATAEATLANISEKISGTVENLTFSASLGIGIKSTDVSGAVVTNANIPEQLKTAVAFIAVGGIAQNQRIGGVLSYTIGQKTVSFADNAQASFVSMIVKQFAGSFKKFNVF